MLVEKQSDLSQCVGGGWRRKANVCAVLRVRVGVGYAHLDDDMGVMEVFCWGSILGGEGNSR